MASLLFRTAASAVVALSVFGANAALAAGKRTAQMQSGMLKLLEGAQGQDFDMLYVDMQAGAHMEAVALFDTYSKPGDDAALTSFAKQTLPTLEMRLMHVKELVAQH